MAEALTKVDFSALTATIEAIVPVVVSVLGIRKGISFMMGVIQGA